MRSGSKRFIDKNLAMLDGGPLWTRAVSKAVATMDRVIVNTDYQDIVCNGICEVYQRPKHLTDGSSYRIDDVFIEMSQTLNLSPNDVLHLFQCTNPFTSWKTIGECRNLLTMFREYDSIQSVCKVDNIYHEYSQREITGKEIRFVRPELRAKHFNSQKKPDRYAFAGYVAFRVGSLLKHNNIWGELSYPVIVDKLEAHDIDTEEDLHHAEALLAAGLVV